MIDFRAPAGSSADARRFAYCLLVAAALHAMGAISPRRHARHPHTEAPAPLRSVVPMSFEDTLVPVESEETPEHAPPPPPPAAPELAPPAPRAPADAPNLEKPHRKADNVAAVAPPRRSDDPKPTKSRAASADAPSPFSGKDGAFRARVCMLNSHVRTALAVEDCKAVAGFRADAIDVAPREFTEGFPGYKRRAEWFGIDYHGRFKVRAAGYYTFRLLSDDGSVLYIDGEQVIDNDGQHSPRSEKMSLPLSKGEHQFRLLYYQGPGNTLAVQLFVKGYKSEERLFGPEL